MGRPSRAATLTPGAFYDSICARCGAIKSDVQIGQEPTPEEYVNKLVDVFMEMHRILRPDGAFWLNCGDTYWGSGKGTGGQYELSKIQNSIRGSNWTHGMPARKIPKHPYLKRKDLIGLPWMVAFALRANGWYLRSDVIWCLSGGTLLYVKTPQREGPLMIKDMVRLNPATMKLWNGHAWTQVLGWSKCERPAKSVELVLRSGERITCTANHQWPTQRGNVSASELAVGDVIVHTTLPEPRDPDMPLMLEDELTGFFVGLYLAEGSRSGNAVQIAGHVKETERLLKLQQVAQAFHGTCAIHKTSVNGCTVNLHGRMLHAIIDTYIGGRNAKTKYLKTRCWRRSNNFLMALLMGYLSGDGHYDADNDRWRLGFCRNYKLEDGLRTLCARLGVGLRLNLSTSTCNGQVFQSFKGEIRFTRSAHHNTKQDGEIVAIQRGMARNFWDIGVADEPHLFALASGILTHNSKPNATPHSVKDRPTLSHEYLFLLTKSARYYFDYAAIMEPYDKPMDRWAGEKLEAKGESEWDKATGQETYRDRSMRPDPRGRRKRTVWKIPTRAYSGQHFAAFPPALITPPILATSRPGDIVLDPFVGSGTTMVTAAELERNSIGIDCNPKSIELVAERFRKAGVNAKLEVDTQGIE